MANGAISARPALAAPTNGIASRPGDPDTDRSAEPAEAEALHARIAELSAANALLREEVAARDAFLAVAAHELRNPMTSIAGYVALLRRNLQRPDKDPAKIAQDIERLNWVVEDYIKRATVLLDVSRITTGRLQLELAPVDVCAIVRKVKGNFQLAADHAGSRLELDLPAGPVLASGDPLALEQVADNLVSNAIKYGAGKPICLEVIGDEVGGVVTLRVRDNGPGISRTDQDRIFERFERAVKVGDRASGFGVGLWIVRHLSEAMDGSVAVHSVPGKGSSFSVTLHLRAEEMSA